MKFKDYLSQNSISVNELSRMTGIPYATLYSGIENPDSLKSDNLKKIAGQLSMTMDDVFSMLTESDTPSLLSVLREQKDLKLKGSIYHNTQVKFAYNTNRIEGSRLTEEETRYIFETNTIINDKPSNNINDIVEVANHFYLFDIMLNTANEALSERLIKEYHRILKNGTVDSRTPWFNVGDYKKHPNEVGGQSTTPPKEVAAQMKKLLSWYSSLETTDLKDIIEFHYRFESIHPFQDGNGRIGRLIMFKECLKHDVVPFIIEDEYKAYYYRGLNKYNQDSAFFMDTCLSMQDKYKAMVRKFLPDTVFK